MQATLGGMVRCSFGAMPTPYQILPLNMVFATTFSGNINDKGPFVNIPPCGMCLTPTNPLVAANFGAPAPCVVPITSPWILGAISTWIGNAPAINNNAINMCAYTGILKFELPGQFSVFVN